MYIEFKQSFTSFFREIVEIGILNFRIFYDKIRQNE